MFSPFIILKIRKNMYEVMSVEKCDENIDDISIRANNRNYSLSVYARKRTCISYIDIWREGD